MSLIEHHIDLRRSAAQGADADILAAAMAARATADDLFIQGRYMDALERTISALRTLRDFSDYDDSEFRHILAVLLFDLSEIHFSLKDYKQSEKELDMLFKILESLIQRDPDLFGPYHIMAMELSTRILRSRKKAMGMLVKQQLVAEELYEKVNSGVVAATDKLVDSLRKVGQLLSSAGDYRAAMKFYAEAIKYSKKRTGRVTRREVKMTIEMAEIMMRVRSMRPRARRLLGAILPHAIALETIELEEDILALTEILDTDLEHEPKWKTFFHRLSSGLRKGQRGAAAQEEAMPEGESEETESK